MHKIMPNMQAAHGSNIQIYSQVCIYHMFSETEFYHSMKKAFHMSGKSANIISPVI